MNSITKFAVLFLVITGFTACSIMKNEDRVPGYKITVVQGNELTQEQFNQLKTGMHKEDVKLLLGEPQLNNPFRDDSWYYIYTVLKADKFLGKSSLTLRFTGDILTDVSGNPAEYDYGNF